MAIDINDLHIARTDGCRLPFNWKQLEAELLEMGFVMYPSAAECVMYDSTEIVIFRLKDTFTNIHDPKNQVRVPAAEQRMYIEGAIYRCISTSTVHDDIEDVRNESIWQSTGRQNMGLCY